MSDKITVRYTVSTLSVGSEYENSIKVDRAEWEEYSWEEREAFVFEAVVRDISWSYDVEG